MNILLTNDDGYDAPGLLAAFESVKGLGRVHVVAPSSERSACSHAITIRRPINVERIEHEVMGAVFSVDGTPADCVRVAFAALVQQPIDLVLSGINRGANAGVDTFYSGTVAGAREAAILGIPAVAISQAIRAGLKTDWAAATDCASFLVTELLAEPLPAPGFWCVNLPAPIPADPHKHVRRVPVAVHAMPMSFNRQDSADGRKMVFEYGASYWLRDVTGACDYSTIRDGAISVTPMPVFGRF